MTDRHIPRSDLVWGFGAQALQYGAMLLLLPLLASRLSKAEVGLWFVFMTIQSLVMLLDVGFGNSLARSFSYIFAGAKQLLSDGIYTSERGRGADPILLATTIGTAKLIYAVVATVIGVILFAVGSMYIASLGAFSTVDGQVAWGLFAVAVVLNVYFQWYLALLIGSGHVRHNYKAIVILRGGFTLLATGALIASPALWGVSAAYLCAVLLMAVFARRRVAELLHGKPMVRADWDQIQEHFQVLWHNSYRMGLVSIGAFMITKYSVLLAASHYGLATSGSYAITLHIFAAIGAIAIVPLNALLPRIASLRLVGDTAGLKRLLSSCFVLIWLIAILGAAIVLLCGREVLTLLQVKTNLVDSPLLTLIALTALLELNHGAAAVVITSSNRVPFVPAALFSGLVILVLSTLGASHGWPLWAIVAIQTITQLLYNNWRWPLYVVREHKLQLADITAALRRLARGNL